MHIWFPVIIIDKYQNLDSIGWKKGIIKVHIWFPAIIIDECQILGSIGRKKDIKNAYLVW